MINKLFIVLALVAIVLATGIAMAEVTQAPVLEATPEVTPVVPGGEAPVGGRGVFTPEVITSIFALLAFLAVGFAAGRYNPGAIAREIQQNKDIQDSIEKIALNTVPVVAIEHIRDIITDLSTVIDVARRVTDGLPNTAQPPQEPPAG